MKLIFEVNTECRDSVADARNILQFLDNRGPIAGAAAPEKVVEKKQEAKAAAAAAAATAGKVTATTAATAPEKKPVAPAAVESAPSTTIVDDAPTIEELTKVVQALTLSGNRAKLLEILKEYNAPKASAIPAELQREFINKCQAVLDV